MYRFLQEIEVFLAIRAALKNRDIHVLRFFVDELVVMFWGANQHNYGRYMLYLRRLLSPVYDDVLQNAILSSGLVN